MGVFVQGGTDRATAEATLAEGTWTDDATAAAVLDDAVDHPGWSMLQRFEAWLFPEQVLREGGPAGDAGHRNGRGPGTPDSSGQHAPRTVPVLAPTLEDLRRGADGHLQRAVEPLGGRTRADVDDGQATGRSGGSAGEEPDDGASRSPQDDPGTANPRRDSATDSLGDIRIGAQREDGVADDTADDEGEEVSRR